MNCLERSCPEVFKHLSPEERENIELLIQNPSLPDWPDSFRGMPNIYLRSSLFTIIQRGRRKAVKCEKLASFKGVEILYTGWRLDQSDLDVLAHAYHLVTRSSKTRMGDYVQIRAKGFLREIGRKAGKSGREWLKDSLRRLSASAVEINFEISESYRKESVTYVGSLIDEFCHNTCDQTYYLKCNKKLVELFEAGWTRLQWEQRLKLNTDLAKWLHGFYSSHRRPYPLKVSTIKILCGTECSRLSDFRRRLVLALDGLVEVEAVSSWMIDTEDKVHVKNLK